MSGQDGVLPLDGRATRDFCAPRFHWPWAPRSCARRGATRQTRSLRAAVVRVARGPPLLRRMEQHRWCAARRRALTGYAARPTSRGPACSASWTPERRAKSPTAQTPGHGRETRLRWSRTRACPQPPAAAGGRRFQRPCASREAALLRRMQLGPPAARDPPAHRPAGSPNLAGGTTPWREADRAHASESERPDPPVHRTPQQERGLPPRRQLRQLEDRRMGNRPSLCVEREPPTVFPRSSSVRYPTT